MSTTNAEGVTTFGSDYDYFNPVPGSQGASVAGAINPTVVVTSGKYTPSAEPFVNAVTDPTTEAGMFDVNPAFKNETYLNSQQQEGQLTVNQEGALAPGDTDNPLATQDAADVGSYDRDHSAQLPLAPTGVTGVAGGTAGTATVSWTAPQDTDGYALTGYVVTATSSNGGATVVAQAAGNAVTLGVTGLTSAKSYTFTVAAQNAAGTGPASAASGAITAP